MSATTNFPTTTTPARRAAKALPPWQNAALATPDEARRLIDGRADTLKSLTKHKATAARDMLQIIRAYRVIDVASDPDHTFHVAISRQIIKLLADRLNGNEAVAVAGLLEALVDHPFDPAMLADYIACNSAKIKRREQNREAKRRSRARKAGAK